MDVIRELCSFEGRLAGTDAERRARELARRRGCAIAGGAAEVEPTYVHPRYGLVHAAHCALGFAGSLVAIIQPAIGFAIVLVDRRLDVPRPELPLLPAAPAVLPPRLAERRLARRAPRRPRPRLPRAPTTTRREPAPSSIRSESRGGARLARRLPLPLGPFRILFWSLALLLPILGARMAGVDSGLISLLQLIPTLILLVGVFLLIDIELSDVVPGANDNASGVATVLSLAEELGANPPANLDVWVLLTGAEECLQEGMRSFVRAHRGELDRETTYFVNVDTVGRGDVRFETGAGWVVSYQLDRRLVRALRRDRDRRPRGLGNRYQARPLVHGLAGDSMPASHRGLPARRRSPADRTTCTTSPATTPSTTLPSTSTRRALDRAHGFALELVRALDRDVGRRAEPVI